MKRRILLVEGGWQRGTLAAVRSLGRAGHYVAVAGQQRGHSARSRYAAKWYRIPNLGSPSFLDRIGSIVSGGRFDVVFPGDDEHLLFLSEHRSNLEPALFPYPEHGYVLDALDKASLYKAARECGLYVPETRLQPPEDDLAGWIAKDRLYVPGSSHEHKGAAELGDAGARNLVFQRVIDGDLLAVVVLADPDGNLLYAGAQRAEAVFPEPFGVSVRARSVPLDDALLVRIQQLLHMLQWRGIAELQFIQPPTGDAYLIDLNGRFFGSLALSAAMGAELPDAWVASAFGEPVTLARPAIGRRYQWLEGDLRRAAASASPRGQTLAAFRFAPGATHSLWSSKDPAPALRLAGDLARRAVKKATAKKSAAKKAQP